MGKVSVVKTAHTGVTVSDLDRSIAFYRGVLGWEVSDKITVEGPYFENLTGVPGCRITVVYVEAPGHTIELLHYEKPDDKKVSDLRPCDPGHLHLAFEVEDIGEVLAAFKQGGWEPVNPPRIKSEGRRIGSCAIYTRDPDGVFLEFMQPPPAGT
jgi:catechol 2,3-dioxygenase-like lactoylglutathione lyase family enzyme